MDLEVSAAKSQVLVMKASRRSKLHYTEVAGIPVVPVVRYLGVQIDETLDFREEESAKDTRKRSALDCLMPLMHKLPSRLVRNHALMALAKAKCSYMAPVLAAVAPRVYKAMIAREAAVIREVHGLGKGVASKEVFGVVCARHPSDQARERWTKLLGQLQRLREKPPRRVHRWLHETEHNAEVWPAQVPRTEAARELAYK